MERLFRSNYAAMFGLARRLVHDEETARDIVHDVFATLLDDTPDIVTPVYLLQGVRYACLNYIRNLSVRNRMQQLYALDLAGIDDDNGRALLKTYSSQQDYNRTQLGSSFNLKLLDGNLQVAAQPSVSIFRYKGCYDMSKAPFALNASLSYYIRRFFFQASYQMANRTIQGNLGVWYRDRDFYQLQAGWGNNNWNVRLSAINMFRGDWLAATQTLNTPLYSEIMSQGGSYYHRRINLAVTYTFGYGKKVRRGNEVGEQRGAASAILK